MPTRKTTATPELGVEQKILQSFHDDLRNQNGQPVDLQKWVDEVPAELRSSVVPRLLTSYFRFCVAEGATFSKGPLIQQFPDYRDLIDQLFRDEIPNEESHQTVSTRALETTAVYAVNEAPWKAGGQGTLHKSVEAAIGNRQVIVKYLNDRTRTDDFQKEIEVTAKLDHPGVVAVYSQGVEQDQRRRPFFAMRLIHGKTLEERIADFHNRLARQSPRQRKHEFGRSGGIADLIDHIISAANTVSHAHSVGVLHCDLKPRNIICGQFGATIVLDWGSASNCDVPDDESRDSAQPIPLPSTTTCDITYAYASPEQIAMAHHEAHDTRLGAKSDVFALGATLYQALTGKAPFDGRRTQDSQAKDIREQNPIVSKRLSAICEKAMQVAPESRYASMTEFAEELRNWLRDEPIQAAPDNLSDRFFRLARRHKGASLASLILALVLAFGVVAVFTLKAQKQETLNNLDLTLALIEDVCEPLGHDEVQNLKEFDQIAHQVDTFTANYIENDSGNDEQTLARIYHIKAIVQFYFYTGETEDSAAGPGAEKRRLHLKNAIDYLQEAEKLCGDADALTLAENRLTQARWTWHLADLQTGPGEEMENRRATLERLDQVIQALDAEKSSGRRNERCDRILAEAFHLRGQYLHASRHSLEAMGFDSVDDLLTASLAGFEEAIQLLEELPDSSDSMDIARNLARAYGYRGDIYRSQGDVARALEDYSRSLKKRERAKGFASHVESNFQLARGYTNFGMLARDFGSQILESKLFPKGSKHSGQPIEFQVAEFYMSKALKIQKEFQGIGDKRFSSDLNWTSNVAAELYLFAAEHEGLLAEQKTEYLNRARDLVDAVIERVTGRPAEELLAAAQVSRPELPADRRSLALSLMLKMRIGRARDDGAVSVSPARVRALIPLEYGFAAQDEDELVVYFVGSLAGEGGTHIGEIVQQFKRRGFNKLDRLSKHLHGLGFPTDRIESLLSPLSEGGNG